MALPVAAAVALLRDERDATRLRQAGRSRRLRRQPACCCASRRRRPCPRWRRRVVARAAAGALRLLALGAGFARRSRSPGSGSRRAGRRRSWCSGRSCTTCATRPTPSRRSRPPSGPRPTCCRSSSSRRHCGGRRRARAAPSARRTASGWCWRSSDSRSPPCWSACGSSRTTSCSCTCRWRSAPRRGPPPPCAGRSRGAGRFAAAWALAALALATAVNAWLYSRSQPRLPGDLARVHGRRGAAARRRLPRARTAVRVGIRAAVLPRERAAARVALHRAAGLALRLRPGQPRHARGCLRRAGARQRRRTGTS